MYTVGFCRRSIWGSGLASLHYSDTDFAVPEAVLATLQERLKHPVFGYTRWNHPQLKEAIQTWYQTRFQTKIEEHWIMYTPTVIYGISALIQLLTNEGGIILQTPAYDAFLKLFRKISGK